MKQFAEVIKLAAEIREESFNKNSYEKALNKYRIVCTDQYYNKSLRKAVDEAAEQFGFDKSATLPIYLLLSYCWNDILDWSDKIINGLPLYDEDDYLLS